MPTTIHIPDRLLAALDQRARAMRISRNRLIRQALERELYDASEWSPGFLETLRDVSSDTAAAADEMLEAIRSRRTSKPPVDL